MCPLWMGSLKLFCLVWQQDGNCYEGIFVVFTCSIFGIFVNPIKENMFLLPYNMFFGIGIILVDTLPWTITDSPEKNAWA